MTNDRIDPVEAFLAGLGSGFSRAAIGVVAVIAAYGLNSWANTAPYRSFLGTDSLFMIFAWANLGIAFVIGLAALIGGFFAFCRFIVDEGGKLAWFLTFLLFTIYYSPMTFPREDWPGLKGKSFLDALTSDIGEPVLKNDWIRLLICFACVSATYWVLPRFISSVAERFSAVEMEE